MFGFLLVKYFFVTIVNVNDLNLNERMKQNETKGKNIVRNKA